MTCNEQHHAPSDNQPNRYYGTASPIHKTTARARSCLPTLARVAVPEPSRRVRRLPTLGKDETGTARVTWSALNKLAAAVVSAVWARQLRLWCRLYFRLIRGRSPASVYYRVNFFGVGQERWRLSTNPLP